MFNTMFKVYYSSPDSQVFFLFFFYSFYIRLNVLNLDLICYYFYNPRGTDIQNLICAGADRVSALRYIFAFRKYLKICHNSAEHINIALEPFRTYETPNLKLSFAVSHMRYFLQALTYKT